MTKIPSQKNPRGTSMPTNTLRDDVFPILECFYDIPLIHACKILGMSPHTLKGLRIKKGLDKWPFDDVKNKTFVLSWADIQNLRNKKREEVSFRTRYHGNMLI
jgi:hypothetical protein